jgi:hypothetical protein
MQPGAGPGFSFAEQRQLWRRGTFPGCNYYFELIYSAHKKFLVVFSKKNRRKISKKKLSAAIEKF